jgi:hypothetical protein
MAILSFILGRPVFSLFQCIVDGDGSSAMQWFCLFHTISGMQYDESTPVTSSYIYATQKKVQYSLALLIKSSLLVTQ